MDNKKNSHNESLGLSQIKIFTGKSISDLEKEVNKFIKTGMKIGFDYPRKSKYRDPDEPFLGWVIKNVQSVDLRQIGLNGVDKYSILVIYDEVDVDLSKFRDKIANSSV